MSDKTDALLSHLHSDLSYYLDDYQIAASVSGKPLWPDATVEQAQCYALAQSLLKKYNEEDHPSDAACTAALEKFKAANTRCGEWRLQLGTSSEEQLLGGVKQAIWQFWNENGYELFYTFDELHSVGRLGSGMNIYARDSDLYTKLFDSRLSCTNDRLSLIWERLMLSDPRWADAERLRYQRYGTHVVAGNKLSFVNKNVTVARSICTEPTINMWYQLGMAAFLERRLTTMFGIDLRDQPEINGALARIGSESNRYATIDLESASDTISVSMLKEILPSSMLGWLMQLRSPYVTLPSGEVVELKMISSMGNGFTFPLQTLIFCAVVSSVYQLMGYSLKRSGHAGDRNFGVFGDDIIVIKEAAPLVIKTLAMLGFTVNGGKTFIEGPFRESCGQDWFRGSWCRGVYVKRLRSTQDAYVAINGLNRWSARTGISVPNTVGYLVRWARTILYVPPDEADDAGVLVPLDIALTRLHNQRHGLVSYRRSVVISQFLSINEDGDIVLDKGVGKRREVNPSGLLLCFLHGSVKGYRISLRQRRVRYTTRRRVTPCWDTCFPTSRFLTGWRRWSDAVHGNLFPVN